jgi:N-acetylmuramoyl-L-alanine amidase
LRRLPDGTLQPLGGKAPVKLRKPKGLRLLSQRTGARGVLAGKRIALVAGHGWLEDGTGWRTQRSRWDFNGCGNCRGIIEDFFTAEFVTNQLAPLIEGMGGEVVFTREADHSVAEAVINAAPVTSVPAQNGVIAKGQGGTAEFAASFPAPGFRRAYARWTAGADRSTAAGMLVAYAGGESLVDVDQTQPGAFWRSLGRFWFGSAGTLTWTSDGSAALSLGQVKFGGGTFAGKPFWQMAAKTYVTWAGAASAVTANGDVNIRPVYAESLDIDAYVSIHANASGAGSASGTTATGTSVYRYSCQTSADFTLSSQATDCDDPPGSANFAETMQRSIIDGLQAEWDPNWKDRSARVANFGEVRNLIDAPGVLVETAFFDNITKGTDASSPKMADNRALHDPRFREALARSVARGIARLFVASAEAVPDRPRGVSAVNVADGSLRVRWTPVPGATSYKVYRVTGLGADGAPAFDAGTEVSGTSLVLTDLQPGTAYAFSVAALNASGEGYPSAAVAARYRGVKTRGQPANVLVVHAYDRRDAWVQDVDNDLRVSLRHGGALSVFFDGALDDAVPSLAEYALVDVACGKDSTEHDSVSPALIAALTAHVAGGGALIISGEEIAYDLSRGDAADKAFLANVLHAAYVADDAQSLEVGGLGATFELDDGTHGSYAVTFPDVVSATSGGLALTYPDGRGGAVLSGSVFYAGFGLETIVGAAARQALFDALLAGFALPAPSPELQPEEPVTPVEPEQPPVSPEGGGPKVNVEPPGARAGCACASGGADLSWLFLAGIVLFLRRFCRDTEQKSH